MRREKAPVSAGAFCFDKRGYEFKARPQSTNMQDYGNAIILKKLDQPFVRPLCLPG
jgi:hypothetical protein